MSGMSRGMAAMQAAKKRRETSRGSQTYDTYRLTLGDGDTVRFRFTGLFRPRIRASIIEAMEMDEAKSLLALYGGFRRTTKKDDAEKKESTKEALLRRMGEEEPFINAKHVNKINGSYRSHTCTEQSMEEAHRGTERDENGKVIQLPCVSCSCNAKRGKYKNVGFVKEETCFSVYVETKQHKIEGAKGNTYVNCTMDETGKCKNCRIATEKGPVYAAREVGKRKLETNKNTASQVTTLAAKLAKRCIACGEGKIKVEDYLCGARGCDAILADVDDVLPGMKIKCSTCDKRAIPKIKYVCSGCDSPTPGTLMDWPMEISRSGTFKETTYVISPCDGEASSPLPKAARERGVVDWVAELKPISTAEQAALCGLDRDPFSGSSTGADDYEEKEEDDE